MLTDSFIHELADNCKLLAVSLNKEAIDKLILYAPCINLLEPTRNFIYHQF